MSGARDCADLTISLPNQRKGCNRSSETLDGADLAISLPHQREGCDFSSDTLDGDGFPVSVLLQRDGCDTTPSEFKFVSFSSFSSAKALDGTWHCCRSVKMMCA